MNKCQNSRHIRTSYDFCDQLIAMILKPEIIKVHRRNQMNQISDGELAKLESSDEESGGSVEV